MLVIDRVTKHFGKQCVLKNISLQLHEGKIYGLVGANGAGKTTLFHCITGLMDYEGKVFHDQWRPLKNHTGLLETHPYFFDRMTGEEYLHFCCHARSINPRSLTSSEMNIFQLPLKRYVADYSTGMQKKLALQGILLQNNHFYLLDEPFNGIDLMSGLEMKKQLLALQSQDKIILMSSHVLSTMKEICNAIIYLKDQGIEKIYAPEAFDAIEADLTAQA